MVPPETSTIWTAIPPVSWPSPPTDMTVTTHREVDACPRRWALSSAAYPDVWGGRGYPPRLQLNALAGSVVHLALETITKQLVRVGCPSIDHPNATLVLKELGGFTQVVHDCVSRVLEPFAGNPRALPLLEHARRTLRGQASGLRARVQSILSRLRLPAPRQVGAAVQGGAAQRRGPLTVGAFPEIELHAPRIGWKGKADLLVLSEQACEITDFKTGAADEAHCFQVQVYALLWSLDDELNPTGRLVDRLVLAYEGGDVEVEPLKAEELAEFENGLIERRVAAHAAISAHPPEARPSPENCRYCRVRQLCDKYWMSGSQQTTPPGADPRFSDAELKILRRHGLTSWDAVVVLSRVAGAGKPVLLRVPQPIELKPGKSVRVLDAAVAIDPDDEAQTAIITLGMFSEIFTLA